MYKRRLTILICTLVIVGLVFAPFSLPARAIVGVDDALAGGLFMAFFEAMGLSFTFTGIEQSKEGLIEFIQDQYDLYCIHKGVVATLIEDAWAALSDAIFTGGTIKIPKEAAADMSDFAEWIVDEYQLSDNDSAVISSTNVIKLRDGNILQRGVIYPYDYALYFDNGNSMVCTVATDGKSGSITFIYENGNVVTRNWSDRYTAYSSGYFWPINPPSPSNFEFSNVYIALSQGGSYVYYKAVELPGSVSIAQFGGQTAVEESVDSDVINLPGEIPEDNDIYVTVPGVTDVFGGTIEGAADQMLEAALDEDLEASYEITDEPPVYPTPEGPTILNVFTDQLGSFFNTIWHYVSDLVDYTTPFILVWRDQLMGVFPFRLMLPLYASFVLALFLGLYKVFRGVH